MVQIRKESILRQSRAFSRGFMSLLKFILLSAVIPMLFVLRFWLREGGQHSITQTMISLNPPPDPLLFLYDWDQKPKGELAELHHCNVRDIYLSHNFTSWARYILNQTKINTEFRTTVVQEFAIELLEIYATNHGYCDFDKYQPTLDIEYVPTNIGETPPNTAKLVIVIVHKDNESLEHLLQALHLPHHIILILTDPSKESFKSLNLQQYQNVFLLRTFLLIPSADTISILNFRVMNWLTRQNIQYDYLVTLDDSAFPLYSANGLARFLNEQQDTAVWLGRVEDEGNEFDYTAIFKPEKRLVAQGFSKRLSEPIRDRLPDFIRRPVMHRTTSGNLAIYHYDVVQNLVASTQVRELFARAKYTCYKGVDEFLWMAAMTLVDYDNEALDRASVFQAWGTSTGGPCGAASKIAVLSTDENACFRSTAFGELFYGNETWKLLVDARERGYMFARKFSKNTPTSREIVGRIRQELW